MRDYTGQYTAGDKVYKIKDVITGKLYILYNTDTDKKYLIKPIEQDMYGRIGYYIINPDTGKRGIQGTNDFDYTLWDFNIEQDFGGYVMYSAVSPVRKYRTFALTITYGIRWYGADSTVRRVFFAKRNPANHDDSSGNFYYRSQISASSVVRILRLVYSKKYPMLHAPIIQGARLWDKDMPDDEGATPYDRMPSVDISFDVPS